MADFNTGLSAEQLIKALNAVQTINNEEPDENHNVNINVVAADVSYDNTESNLEAENVQDAIDEVVEKIEQTNTSVTTNTTNITNLQAQVTSNTSNISTINTTTTSLQNQINNIVTPVTVDAEVQNARVGSDSTSYASLKDRLDSENTSLKDELTELASATSDTVEPVNLWNPVDGYDTPSGYHRTYFKSVELNVNPGDIVRGYIWNTASGITKYYAAPFICLVAYNSEDQVVSESSISENAENNGEYTVPSGIAKVQVAFNTASYVSDRLCVIINATAPNEKTDYFAPYKAILTDDSLAEPNVPAESKAVGDRFKTFDTEIKTRGIKIVVPKILYLAVGIEYNFYFRDFILCGDLEKYYIEWGIGGLAAIAKQTNECLRITPVSAGEVSYCSVAIYDRVTNEKIVQTPYFKIVISDDISDESETTKKAIFIGDSLTDRGIFVAEIQHNLSNGRIQSIGTITDTVLIDGEYLTISNEGRSGWGVKTYVKKESSGNFTNAFWNPLTEKFDFSFYMSDNGFSDVDYVVITLGTNDVANLQDTDYEVVISSFAEIIESIHTYDSSIIVVISLTTPCATNDSWAFGQSGHTVSANRFTYYQMKLVSLLIENFSDTENVILSPTYGCLDTLHDFPTREEAVSARNPLLVTRQTDNVHPSIYGYLKMADCIYSTMLSAFNDNDE